MPLEPIPDPTWWELVAHWRIRTGQTKAELAKACGVSRTQLFRIETGRSQATPEQVTAIETAIFAALAEKNEEETVAA